MRKAWLRVACLALVAVLLFFAAFFLIRKIDESSIVMANASSVRKVIIDPGHGGEDGGAVGYSGTIEKDLNLAISLRLKDLLEWNGFEVEMTRDTDRSIHDEGLSTIGERKKSDMYHRLDLYNSDLQAVVISIHLNQYPDSSIQGSQVFTVKTILRRKNWQNQYKMQLKHSSSRITTVKSNRLKKTCFCFFMQSHRQS